MASTGSQAMHISRQLARNCSCCVFMLGIGLAFAVLGSLQVPFIGSRIASLSKTQLSVLVIGLSIALCNLMPASRLDRFAEAQRIKKQK